jgi:Tfp pilus assembly protein PilX
VTAFYDGINFTLGAIVALGGMFTVVVVLIGLGAAIQDFFDHRRISRR